MISIGTFAKRVNEDKTIDLICKRCFQTAARGTSDAEALAMAQQHACLGPLFAEMEKSEEKNYQFPPGYFLG